MPAELFYYQGRKLRFNDTVTYRCATVAYVQNPDAPEQPAETGPYTGQIVDFTDTGSIGVRADGWWGAAPLYYVYVADVLSVTPYQPERTKPDTPGSHD